MIDRDKAARLEDIREQLDYANRTLDNIESAVSTTNKLLTEVRGKLTELTWCVPIGIVVLIGTVLATVKH